MPDDLPEIGLSAGIENLDKFAQDAKKVQDSYRQMAEAEAQVQKASEQQVAATEAAGQAWVASAGQAEAAAAAWADAAQVMTDAQTATGAQAEEVETAEQAWEGLFAQFGAIKDRAGAVAQGQTDLIKAMDQGSRSAVTTEKAYAVLEDAYQRIAQRDGPEVVDALREMEQQFLDAGGTVEEWALQVRDAAGEAAEGLVDAADEASSAWENMAALLSLGAMQQVAGTVGRAGDQLLGMAKDAAMTAARIEELDAVMANLAEQNDLTASALRNQVEAVKAQGIQSSVAYNLVTQFVQANLSLEKASILARVAQDAAVISMEDSSQALAGMLHGIMTLQPEVLRYRGIIVDLQGDYQRWAEANNRTVMSMTGAEKQLVALDSVIAEGVKLTGTYESAMGTASKQMRSFSRYTEELKEEFGDSLLPVLTEGVFVAKDLVKAVSALPEPLKASLAASGALSGVLLKGTSAMVSFGSQAAMLAFALKSLNISIAGTSLAVLGPAGLIVALGAIAGIGLVTYLGAQEEAHRKEAATIAESADTYEEYIQHLEDAALEGYAFSEALWEVIHAKQEADKEFEDFDTEALQRAAKDVEALVLGLWSSIGAYDAMIDEEEIFAARIAQLKDDIDRLIPTLDDMELMMLADADSLRELGAQIGLEGDALDSFVETIFFSVNAIQLQREAVAAAEYSMATLGATFKKGEIVIERYSGNMVNLAEVMLDTVTSQRDLREAMTEMMQAAMDADPAVEKLTYQIMKLREEAGDGAAIQWSIQRLADIARDAEEDIANLRDRARADEEKAQSRYFDNLEKLEQDHAKRRAAIQEDIAEVHQDLLDDMEKAEEDYQADRLKLAEDYAQDIADAEAKLAQDRADLNADLLQDLADAERDHAQDLVDAREDLGRDFEDIQRKLQAKLLDLEAENYKAREELAVEYGDRLKSITEKYASEAEAIAKKYSLEPDLPDFDERREGLLKELEELKDGYVGGWEDLGRKQQLMAALEKVKEEELAALEERKKAELDALAAWLDEEQKVQDDAYQEAIDKQIAAAVAQAEERLLQYQRRLEDMDKALEKERQELQRRHDERLDDLEQAHSRQLAELERANAERLVALDEQLAQEQARMAEAAQQRRESLAEQLADEQDAYRERRVALGTALDEEKELISTKLGEATTKVGDEALKQKDAMVTAWNAIDPAIALALQRTMDTVFVPKFNEMERLSYDKGRAAGEAYARGFLDGGGVHSIPDWAMYFGEEVQKGLETGLDKDELEGWAFDLGQGIEGGFNQGLGGISSVLGDQLDEFGKFKVDTEGILEVGSPSKWAGRMGEAVSEGFANTATLEPNIGSFAMDAFESDIPSVPGQDMGIDPFLTGIPEIPAQEMAVTPYLLDVEGLAAQSQVQAPTPPMMAAGGMGGGSTTNRINNLQFDAHYSRHQSERSLRQDVELIRMGMRW